MAAPRRWGDGKVSLLVPSLSALWDIKTRAIGLDEYRERFVARLEPAEIGPGSLLADFDDGDEWEGIGSYPGRFVADGDTLCCACSRDEAAAGRYVSERNEARSYDPGLSLCRRRSRPAEDKRIAAC